MARQKINQETGVTDREELFSREYVVDMDPVRAAIAAGFAPISAERRSADLLKRQRVQTRIAHYTAKIAEQSPVKANQVLEQVARHAFFDPRRLVDAQGNMIPLGDLPADVAMAIQGIEVTRYTEMVPDQDGKPQPVTRVAYKLRFADRNKAADMLMRHLGLYEKDNAQRPANPVQELLEFLAERRYGRLLPAGAQSPGGYQSEPPGNEPAGHANPLIPLKRVELLR